MTRATLAFLSLSLVLSSSPVFANEQRTITIYGGNGGKVSSLNSPYWTHVKTFNNAHTLKARKGYIFWTGSCDGMQKYLEMGDLGGGEGRWCLRRDTDYEEPFVEEPGSFQREPPPNAVNPDASAQQTQNNNPVASATKEPQGQTPNDPFIYWTSRGVNVPLFGGLVFVILVLIGLLINKSAKKP